jgi:hypothetical protein
MTSKHFQLSDNSVLFEKVYRIDSDLFEITSLKEGQRFKNPVISDLHFL